MPFQPIISGTAIRRLGEAHPMKLFATLLALALALPCSFLSAQAKSKAKARPAASTRPLPPFSGTWILNLDRSTIEGERPGGINKAIIQYDGKHWHYSHSHVDTHEDDSNLWQVSLIVGSPTLHVEREPPLTFRSRIFRQGDALVMTETIRVDNGQHTSSTIRYTLEDNGNTLVELETQKGPLGTQTNRYVLERENAHESAATPAN